MFRQTPGIGYRDSRLFQKCFECSMAPPLVAISVSDVHRKLCAKTLLLSELDSDQKDDTKKPHRLNWLLMSAWTVYASGRAGWKGCRRLLLRFISWGLSQSPISLGEYYAASLNYYKVPTERWRGVLLLSILCASPLQTVCLPSHDSSQSSPSLLTIPSRETFATRGRCIFKKYRRLDV
jgi:hypothetical protein